MGNELINFSKVEPVMNSGNSYQEDLESPFPDFPLEVALMILSNACADPASFNETIRSLASVSVCMKQYAEVILNDKVARLKLKIGLAEGKINGLINQIEQINSFFEGRLCDIEIIPSEEDQRMLSQAHQFREDEKLFIKQQTEVLARQTTFIKLIDNQLERSVFVNYRIYRATQKHFTSLEISLKKMEVLFEEKFQAIMR